MSDVAENSTPRDDDVVIRVLPYQALEEMIHKIIQASGREQADDEVDAWREQYGMERYPEIGHHHVIVGRDLMYLHDCPDGFLVPHVRRPDGTEEMYTDDAHVDALF